MTSACEATTRALPGAAVIELSGEVDGSAAPVLTDAYERAVTASPENHDTVVLDFAAVDYINSTGIALIVIGALLLPIAAGIPSSEKSPPTEESLGGSGE